MTKGRLEAFSDAVIAIILTIMVLELKVPHGTDLESLGPLLPVFSSYVMSFVYLGIYWNNHHHMLHTVKQVNGAILWANMHLLFWLSLIPFTTAWVGEHDFATVPVALYGFVLLMAGVAYYILARTLVAHHGKDSLIARALGADFKGKVSVLFYGIAIGLAFLSPLVAFLTYVLVAVVWLVPDRRMANVLSQDRDHA